ncbi:MAG TPA: PAS domain-containing sensor histidine kinase [bacterium]|nr:PAS domain-containing sensor histidine kinase [bacterium]
MRTGSLPSAAADLLHQSLEHLAAPAIVVEGPDAPTVRLANASARHHGIHAGDPALAALGRSLHAPPDETAALAKVLSSATPTTSRWSHPDQGAITLRVTPLAIDGDGSPPCVVTWSTASAPASSEPLQRANARTAGDDEQALSAVVDDSPIGIQVLLPDGRPLRTNPAMHTILATATAADHHPPCSLMRIPLAQCHGLDLAFERAASGEVAHVERCSIPAGDSQRWLDCDFFPVFDQNRKVTGVVAFARDISKRVTAQQQREALEKQLRQSQKLEAIGRLAGGVAHDFNNVLTSVRGYADILLLGIAPDHPHRELVQQIHRAAERGAALTRQLAAFGRVQITRIETFDASNAVIEMMPMLRRLLETNIHVDLTAKGSAPVRADRSQLQQVLVNLLMNARDAMPDGGTIHVSVEPVHVGGDRPKMRLKVQDSGLGMDEATRQRVFDPFFTTKQSVGTIGLGLSTVYGIVKEAGGTVGIDSREGEGTTVCILWPLATADNPAPTPDSEPSSSGDRPPRDVTILVAEDDATNRALAVRVLKDLGYSVLAAEDGQAALQLAAEQEHIDLLLTDVVMPGLGGRQLAERLAHVHPEAGVLFTSGHTTDDVLRQGIREDGVAFLPKPYSTEQLAHAVRDSLRSMDSHTRRE